MQRVVVVSGGGSGIGHAVAKIFARDGDDVVLVGRRVDTLSKAADEITNLPNSASVTAVSADLTDPDQVAWVRSEIVEQWNRVDVLVNAAGGDVMLDADPETTQGVPGAAWQWLENFRANTLTAVLLTEALKPHVTAPDGRVLLISSIAACHHSGSDSYAGSKAALHPYAYGLARELGPQGVTVNVVAPGYIADTEFFRGQLSAEREQLLIDQTLDRRSGTPADVAETIFWLASAAAGHVTGQVIQVDGGARAH